MEHLTSLLRVPELLECTGFEVSFQREHLTFGANAKQTQDVIVTVYLGT